ncbi:hypothetical protein BDD14_2290 [Edaphobacter modestus]|uniref:Uncharacterized protein n=1 Tax=Edaphobacter modestus TaxID=388466 RepID=A0A4V2G4G5_9BACT|nr:hypothetical protein BDD14_2290 [Edaphobacter modestus]
MKTKSESLLEGFLAANNLPFEKIDEDTCLGRITASLLVAVRSSSS